jgi:urea carboxylase-associated protein 2
MIWSGRPGPKIWEIRMDEHSPEFYRRRYFELKARAQAHNASHLPPDDAANPRDLPEEVVVADEIVPAGWYWSRRIAPGQSLRLVNEQATHGVSVLIWNAHDTSERLNPADSVKVQWTARLGRGKLLLSDMGRALASITDDTCGFHDAITGCSTREGDERKFGADSSRRNGQENFILAAVKHGLSCRDVGPCVTFFAPVVTDKQGRFSWSDDLLKAGDYVDLRAEMELIVALSNCPHPLSPVATWSAKDIRVQIWNSPQPRKNDLCRNAGEEALRAFDNNNAYLAGA